MDCGHLQLRIKSMNKIGIWEIKENTPVRIDEKVDDNLDRKRSFNSTSWARNYSQAARQKTSLVKMDGGKWN